MANIINPISADGNYDSGTLSGGAKYAIRCIKDSGTGTITLSRITEGNVDAVIGGSATGANNLDIIVEASGADRFRLAVSSAASWSARFYITEQTR